MSSRKAKQSIRNTSAQVARADAYIKVEPVAGLPMGPGPTDSQASEAGTTENNTAEDQADASSEEPAQLLNGLPPIYLALAISINVAADFQNKTRNVVD